MFEFIDDKVVKKECIFTNVQNEYMAQNFSKEKIHYLGNEEVMFPKTPWGTEYETNGKSLFMQSLHSSFDNHQSFTISPDSIWYMISYEIATHISLNNKKYKDLFTTYEGVEKLRMRINADWLIYGSESNDWGRVFNMFREHISSKVPKLTQQMLMLDFSTSTEESKLAMLAIFMDMLQYYYTFIVQTRCGIPSIKVTGTIEDWGKIIKRVEQLGDSFVELKGYIRSLRDTLCNFVSAAYEDKSSSAFWRSIYKYQSMSGGDLITGWINSLFAYDYSGADPKLKEKSDYFRLEHFPTHITRVPFVWEYLGTSINMRLIFGFLGNSVIDGYMTPELGFRVSEIV